MSAIPSSPFEKTKVLEFNNKTKDDKIYTQVISNLQELTQSAYAGFDTDVSVSKFPSVEFGVQFAMSQSDTASYKENSIKFKASRTLKFHHKQLNID